MGVKTKNEIRTEMGLSPMAGGDELPVQYQFGGENENKKDNKEDKSNVPKKEEGNENKKEQDSSVNSEEDKTKKETSKGVTVSTDDENKEERDRLIRQPFSDGNRPNGSFKSIEIADEKIRGVASQNNIPFEVLSQGVRVEQEHASTVNNDEETIIGIALDHIKEDIDYYRKLEQVEKSPLAVKKKLQRV
jgi:hypothetical protein